MAPDIPRRSQPGRSRPLRPGWDERNCAYPAPEFRWFVNSVPGLRRRGQESRSEQDQKKQKNEQGSAAALAKALGSLKPSSHADTTSHAGPPHQISGRPGIVSPIGSRSQSF